MSHSIIKSRTAGMVGAAGLALGAAFISSAPSAEAVDFNMCTAEASLDRTSSVIEADGRASCSLYAGEPTVGVTVVLYLDGEVVNSSYKGCTWATLPGAQFCDGYAIASSGAPTDGDWCAKTTLTYKVNGTNESAESRSGYGCR